MLDDIGYMTCMTLVLLGTTRRPGIWADRSPTLPTMLQRIWPVLRTADSVTITAGRSILTPTNS